MKKGKIIVLIIIIILIAALAVWYFLFFRKKEVKTVESNAILQSVEALQSSSYSTNRYNGVVETQKTEKTEFDPQKKLKELYVAEGSHVEKGQLLFAYDTESLNLEIEQLLLEIEKLNTTVANLNDQIFVLTDALNKATTDTARLEYTASITQAQSDIAQAQFDIKTKQADIAVKQASIASSAVESPISGTVISVANADDIIAGINYDASGVSSNVYITVMADGQYRIKCRINEMNIHEITAGDEVTAISRVNSNDTWSGYIATIETGQTDASNSNTYYSDQSDRSSNYAFYIELESTEGLMVGQHLIIEKKPEYDHTGGIWLPTGFIVINEQGEYTVMASANSDPAGLTERPVTVGDYDYSTDMYEITGGLLLSDYVAWPADTDLPGEAL